jgi:hypothetical protein
LAEEAGTRTSRWRTVTRRFYTVAAGSGDQRPGEVHGDEAIRSSKSGARDCDQRVAIQLVLLRGGPEQLQVPSRIEKLDVNGTSRNDSDVTVVVVYRLLAVIAAVGRQIDRKSIGLAVVIGSHKRLLS